MWFIQISNITHEPLPFNYFLWVSILFWNICSCFSTMCFSHPIRMSDFYWLNSFSSNNMFTKVNKKELIYKSIQSKFLEENKIIILSIVSNLKENTLYEKLIKKKCYILLKILEVSIEIVAFTRKISIFIKRKKYNVDFYIIIYEYHISRFYKSLASSDVCWYHKQKFANIYSVSQNSSWNQKLMI